MRLAGHNQYTIIAFSPDEVSVCRFRRAHQKYKLADCASVPVKDGDRAAAVKTALKESGGLQGCVILTGDLPGGGFFRCPALPVSGLREQRAALEFELPRRILHPVDDPVIQFTEEQTAGEGIWHVYTFPGERFLSLEALLTPCHGKADEFIHPLLTLRSADPDIMLPKLERDFVFSGGEWRPSQPGDEMLSTAWKEEFARCLILPPDLKAESCTECLLVMRFLISAALRDSEKTVRVLPSRLRPKRLRSHLIITLILLVTWGGVYMYDMGRVRIKAWQEYQTLLNERNNLKSKTAKIRASLKKKEKENKELQRILQLQAGDPDLLTHLAELCRIMPSDAMVSMFRFSENTVDLVIQSESENLNLPQVLKALPYWKIAQLNQRTMNDNVSFITLKLQKAEETK